MNLKTFTSIAQAYVNWHASKLAIEQLQDVPHALCSDTAQLFVQLEEGPYRLVLDSSVDPRLRLRILPGNPLPANRMDAQALDKELARQMAEVQQRLSTLDEIFARTMLTPFGPTQCPNCTDSTPDCRDCVGGAP